MEKVDNYLKELPAKVSNLVNQQTNQTDFFDFLKKVEDDIARFKKFGTFKPTNDTAGVRASKSKKSTKASKSVLQEQHSNDIPQLKLERISEVDTNGISSERRESFKENVDIKIEKPDMPPPQLPLKKIKKSAKESIRSSTRSTRSKASKVEQTRDSDVILQKEDIETIQVNDSDETDEEKDIQTKTRGRTTRTKTRINEKQIEESPSQNSDIKTCTDETESEPTTRTTRTKTRAKEKKITEQTEKRSRSPSTDIEKKSKKGQQTKRKKSEEVSEKESSIYEDAQSDTLNGIKPILNETYVTHNESTTMNKTSVIQKDVINTTVTLENPVLLKNKNKLTSPELKDIMTDDEDDNIVITLPTKQKTLKKGTKPIFSPFDGSPVKKRVEAFEKLGAEPQSEIPIRTRTKTKALGRNNEQVSELYENNQTLSSKRFFKVTPQQSRCLPVSSYSASRVNDLISTKSASALKATQQEFKEREIRRREKEADAIKKREALLQMQVEEKKKKQEEKQIKAQQVREALEKTKQAEREQAKKAKEEKHKLVIAEKQEKIKKHQEETERKRVEAMKKATEERRKEEERRRIIEDEKLLQNKLKEEELKKALDEKRLARHMEIKKKARHLPIYLKQKTPLLPTDDCYDSDQEVKGKGKIRLPSWMSETRIAESLNAIQCINKSVKQKYFMMNVTTPDLVDIFETIDPRKLKRTSSAVWRAPPRFTLMPNTIDENGEEDD